MGFGTNDIGINIMNNKLLALVIFVSSHQQNRSLEIVVMSKYTKNRFEIDFYEEKNISHDHWKVR